jgi:hypothetical protein
MHRRVQYLLSQNLPTQEDPRYWAERANGITASTIAKGLTKTVYKDGENEMSRYGQQMEGAVACTYMDNYFESRPVRRLTKGMLVWHESYPWLGATVDYLRDDGTIVEVKTTYWKPCGSCPKPYWFIQVQIQMEVFNLPTTDIVTFDRISRQFKVYHIKRDTKWFDAALPAIKKLYYSSINKGVDNVISPV